MDGVSLETIEAGIKLYHTKFSDVSSHKINDINVSEAVQKKKEEDSGDDDFETEDLDEAAAASRKGMIWSVCIRYRIFTKWCNEISCVGAKTSFIHCF